MLQTLQKLMKDRRQETEDVSGYLTQKDIEKLKSVRAWGSVHRKKTIKSWHCNDCKKSFYYQIIKCPLCESQAITEIIQPTQYTLAGPRAEMKNINEVMA